MISTHILDTSIGKPAAGVSVTLELKSGEHWKEIAKEKTNGDGRITFSMSATAGSYRLSYNMEEYFAAHKQEYFFENAQVAFKIKETNRKYHVPLLLNPFGYTTYRGS